MSQARVFTHREDCQYDKMPKLFLLFEYIKKRDFFSLLSIPYALILNFNTIPLICPGAIGNKQQNRRYLPETNEKEREKVSIQQSDIA